MEFREHRLENGLEIVAECNPEAWSAAVGFFVNAGARDEADEIAGVSHFLEHMLFKGTPSRSADEVNAEFDRLGAHYNAYTSEENTVYYAAVLPEFLAPVVALLADIMRPALREEDFDTEKKVILEEIAMYEDQPPFGADEKCRAAHYGQHPLGRSVLGTQASVAGLPVEAMREYFRRRYSPGNIVVVAAGRVDFDALVADVQKACGHWDPVQTERLRPIVQPGSGLTVVKKEIATQQYAVQLSAGPSAADIDRYPAKLLTTVLGDDTGSRLYWDLIDTGLAEHASLSHYDYEDSGLFMTYLSCEPESAAENLRRVADIYRRVEDEGITAQELSQAKNKIASRVVLSGERPRGRLFAFGGDWVQRREYCSTRDDLDAVAAITLDDITAVLEKYSLSDNTTVAIGPLDSIG